jgi:hypothetical protein
MREVYFNHFSDDDGGEKCEAKKIIDSPSEIMFIFRMILFTKVLLSLSLSLSLVHSKKATWDSV